MVLTNKRLRQLDYFYISSLVFFRYTSFRPKITEQVRKVKYILNNIDHLSNDDFCFRIKSLPKKPLLYIKHRLLLYSDFYKKAIDRELRERYGKNSIN